MKKPFALLVAMIFVLSACTLRTEKISTPVVIVVTATNQPVLASSTPTNTLTLMPSFTPTLTPSPSPTLTPSPAPTLTPSLTPTLEPVTVAEFESALLGDGYTRQAFKGIGNYTDLRPGIKGYIYTKDNVYEPIKVYADGYVRLEVLNDPSVRASRMERKLRLLDQIFPAEFMVELRKANDAYLKSALRSVYGDPAQLWSPSKNDFWRSIEGQYNVSNTTIVSYPVVFSLWFWQITCPEGYVCWLKSFPGEIFIGQNSLVFYDIEINISP